MKYLCPSCSSPLSKWVVIKKYVSCSGCGEKVTVSATIGAALAIPVFLAGGISYSTGNYYISAGALLVASIIVLLVSPGHLRIAD